MRAHTHTTVGFSDIAASSTVAWHSVGSACGGAVGGYLGDYAATRLPNTGRVRVAQMSIVGGLPFILLMLFVVPRDETYKVHVHLALACTRVVCVGAFSAHAWGLTQWRRYGISVL